MTNFQDLSSCPVGSIFEYLMCVKNIAIRADHGQTSPHGLAFRGHGSHKWELNSSAERRLNTSFGKPPTAEEFVKYHEDVILACKRNRFDRLEGERLHELELLAHLQHNRAATCLIDFTLSSLVALWFATEDTGEDGKVCVVNTDTERFLEVTPGDIEGHSVSEILNFETREGSTALTVDSMCEEVPRPSIPEPQFWRWTPANLNERILAQHSLFIFGPMASGRLVAEEIVIQAARKAQIREDLKDLHNIDEESLFPDFVGFAYTQRHDAIYGPMPTDYMRLARSAMQRGEYSLALHMLGNSIRLNPNDRRAYQLRSSTYERLGDFESATHDYSKLIELDPQLLTPYSGRAAAYESLGDFESAIHDYTKLVELTNYSSSMYFAIRAEAFEGLGDFESAVEDYSRAIEITADADHLYVCRAVARLCLRQWSPAKADLRIAQEMGTEIPEFFSDLYGSVAEFERRMSLQLPEEIISLIAI
ncbi:MAG: FRG domain-containing protein [Chloroflexota bacterium]|nr:FRG domain-containing protein [Chloroflexota bacterium]